MAMSSSSGRASSKLPEQAKVVLTYAERDVGLGMKLRMWLAPLEQSGRLVVVRDAALSVRFAWDNAACDALRAADFLIVLVTEELVASGLLERAEIEDFLAEGRDGVKVVIPIRCDDGSRSGSLDAFSSLQIGDDFQSPQDGGRQKVLDTIVERLEAWSTARDPLGLNQALAQHPILAQLPPLFPGVRPRTLAQLYVELRIAQPSNRRIAPALLTEPKTLADLIHEREQHRFSHAVPIEDALHRATASRFVLLGEPGSGKSSLLKFVALRIAQRQWSRWTCPLHAEIRLLAARKPPGDPWDAVTLLSLVLEGWNVQRAVARQHAERWLSGDIRLGQPLLILDGLDEIVGDPEAHAALCDVISRLPPSVPWIVASRHSGLTQALGEHLRYEIAPLDDMAIETLVTNWFRCDEWGVPAVENPVDVARGMLAEVFKNPRLLTMARSPFLASALCFLKERLPPDAALPLTRAEIYETLVGQIAKQAQVALMRPDVLDRAALTTLQSFCYWLYSQATPTPLQIFQRHHWHQFVDDDWPDTDNTGADAIDFDNQVLAGRLIAQLREDEQDYHFLHLSLQEFLIARHLLKRPVLDALRRRFLPAWRAIILFYGTLLFRHGRIEDFKALVRGLADPPDLGNVMLIEVAQLLSDASIVDSGPYLGYDLTGRLWTLWLAGEHYVSAAAFEALSRLPTESLAGPIDDLIAKTRRVLTDMSQPFEDEARRRGLDGIEGLGGADTAAGSFVERSLRFEITELAQQLPNPFALLAARRDGASEVRLLDQFLNEPDEKVAVFMAASVAQGLSATGRNEFVRHAQSAWVTKRRARFLVGLRAVPAPAFVAAAGQLIVDMDLVDPDYGEVLEVLGRSGSAEALQHLDRELRRCLERHDGSDEILSLISRNIALHGSSRALDILETAAFGASGAVKATLMQTALTLRPPDEAALLTEVVGAPKRSDVWAVLQRLDEWLDGGHAIGATTMRCIADHVRATSADEEGIYAVHEWALLFSLDQNRVLLGEVPVLQADAEAFLNGLLVAKHQPVANLRWRHGSGRSVDSDPDETDDDELPMGDARRLFPILAAYLASIDQTEAIPALVTVATQSDRQWTLKSVLAALDAIGVFADTSKRWSGEGKKDVAIHVAETFLDCAPQSLSKGAEAAAYAVGRCSVDELFARRALPAARLAMSRLSSERGYLFYESFYVTPAGSIEDRVTHRDPVFVAIEHPSSSAMVERLLTHLSGWHCIPTFDAPATCLGGLVVVPDGRTLADIAADSIKHLDAMLAENPAWPILLVTENDDSAKRGIRRLKRMKARNVTSLVVHEDTSESDFDRVRHEVERWRATTGTDR